MAIMPMTVVVVSAETLSKLTRHETDILIVVADGQTNHDIAQTLLLSEGTVRNYVSQIFTKLEVADRTQPAVIAWRNGLVQR